MTTMISEAIVDMLHEFCIAARRAISEVEDDNVVDPRTGSATDAMKHNLRVSNVIVSVLDLTGVVSTLFPTFVSLTFLLKRRIRLPHLSKMHPRTHSSLRIDQHNHPITKKLLMHAPLLFCQHCRRWKILSRILSSIRFATRSIQELQLQLPRCTVVYICREMMLHRQLRLFSCTSTINLTKLQVLISQTYRQTMEV